MHLKSNFFNLVPDWLRWIILFPCSILFCYFFYKSFLLCGKIIHFEPDASHLEITILISIGNILAAFCAGGVYIYCCNFIAPNNQEKASMILLIIFLLGAVYIIFCILWFDQAKYTHSFKYISACIGVILEHIELYPKKKETV